MKHAKLKVHLFPIASLVILAIISHHAWFFDLSPLTHGDFFYNFEERVKEVFSYPYIWQSYQNLGSVDMGIAFWPFLLLSGFLANLGFLSNLTERIVFFWPIAVLQPLAMYCLAFHLLRSRSGAWTAAIVYAFNAAALVGQTGILTVQMSLAFIPLFILFYILTLEKRSIIYLVLASIFGFIVSFYEFRFFYLTAWLTIFYYFYFYFVIETKKNLRNFIRLGFIAVIPIMTTLILNTYLFFGLFSLRSITNNIIFSRDLTGQAYVDILKGLTLFPYLWTGKAITPFIVRPILSRFFIIPILVFIGYLLVRKNKQVNFFALIGLVGIFLLKQEAIPFTNIYKWIYEYVPGFSAFRESTKFYFYISLSYSILIGALISGLFQLAKTKKQRLFSFLLIGLISLLFLWNTIPLITQEIGTLFVPRKIPKDYLILKDFIFNQKEYFRTYWLPTISRWGAHTKLHPRVSNIEIVETDWKNILPLPLTNYGQLLNYDFSDRLFDIASIKYLIIPIQDKENDDNFFVNYGQREGFIQQANRTKYLSNLQIGTHELLIYENKNYRPHLYQTYEKESFYRYVPFQNVDYLSPNPTQYKILLKNVLTPIYLNFSESFHPDWKLRVGEFKWYEVLTGKNYFLPDKNHFKNDAGLNSFFINPSEVCSSLPCNVSLTLYFRPQSYVYLGLIISGITFLTLIAALSFLLIKEHVNPPTR